MRCLCEIYQEEADCRWYHRFFPHHCPEIKSMAQGQPHTRFADVLPERIQTYISGLGKKKVLLRLTWTYLRLSCQEAKKGRLSACQKNGRSERRREREREEVFSEIGFSGCGFCGGKLRIWRNTLNTVRPLSCVLFSKENLGTIEL